VSSHRREIAADRRPIEAPLARSRADRAEVAPHLYPRRIIDRHRRRIVPVLAIGLAEEAIRLRRAEILRIAEHVADRMSDLVNVRACGAGVLASVPNVRARLDVPFGRDHVPSHRARVAHIGERAAPKAAVELHLMKVLRAAHTARIRPCEIVGELIRQRRRDVLAESLPVILLPSLQHPEPELGIRIE
jgi:hypothetical protein